MKKENSGLAILIMVMIVCAVLFGILYTKEYIAVETPQAEVTESVLAEWTVEESVMNGAPLEEDKSIYGEPDNSIYDVYISVFPTKDENGEMLDFSAFGKHVARDHSYNPTLNCNIQILNEDERLDPLLNLDAKNATIRVRGNSSRGDKYKGYKVKFSDENREFLGQKTLNINKHTEDSSKITTKFCTDVLQQMDNIASYRTNFMRVWIRDVSLPKSRQKFEYYGLYTHIEQPNKQYLESRGLSSDCEMYKARDFSFRLVDAIKDVDDPEYSKEEFETVLNIREGNSHEKLIEMLEAVNDETRNFEEVFATYFNEENYLTWLAFNLLVGGEDILNHNYILYSPQNSKTWYFIPWDFDSNLDYKDSWVVPSLRNGQKLNQVILHRRYFRVPGNIDKIKLKMEELLQNQFSEENIESLTAGYIPVLEKTITLEPDVGLLRRGMTPEDVVPFIHTYPDLIQKKYQDFVDSFKYPAPMFVNVPEKNEDGTLHLAWDASYSYQGRTLVYNVQIARDCYMNDVVYTKKNVVDTFVDTNIKLPAGTYYLKVTVVDSEGNEQLSLEHYEFSGDRFIYENGILEFEVE